MPSMPDTDIEDDEKPSLCQDWVTRVVTVLMPLGRDTTYVVRDTSLFSSLRPSLVSAFPDSFRSTNYTIPLHTQVSPDQILSSLSSLLDWLSIPGNYDSLKGKDGSNPQDGCKRASAYLKERGCTTSLTPPGIRSKVNGKALPFKSLHCGSSFLDNTPSFGLNQGQRLEIWD
nr:hypothetical protein L203_03236 [Cryptococcus depauperatus CBS 7841]